MEFADELPNSMRKRSRRFVRDYREEPLDVVRDGLELSPRFESVKLEISSRPLNSLKSAKIAEVKQIIGNRSINVLTLSVGGNDVGFVSEVESLIANTATGSPSLASIQSSVNAGLKSEFRAGQGDQGARCRQGPDHRLPDQTRNQAGVVSAIPGPRDHADQLERRPVFLSTITIPLNKAIAAAAKANRWTFVDILPAFSTHRYPSTDTWIR